MQNWRVAIVGCGNVAGAIDDDPKKRHIYGHARAIQEVRELKLVACCDTEEHKAKEYADRWNVPKWHGCLPDMLQEEIDILVIATPTFEHYNHVSLGMESQAKVIFCEKPLDFYLGLARELIRWSVLTKKPLLINYTRRWDKFYQKCYKLLPQLGRIETIVAYVDTALYMNSSHMLDMLAWYAGPAESCLFSQIDRQNEVRVVHGAEDPGAIALFKHTNGIISFLKATGETPKNHQFELDIQGTEGRLRILDDDMRYELYKFKESPQFTGLKELELVEHYHNIFMEERLVLAYQDIVEYLKTGKRPIYTAEESLESLRMMEMIHANQ